MTKKRKKSVGPLYKQCLLLSNVRHWTGQLKYFINYGHFIVALPAPGKPTGDNDEQQVG